MFDFIQPFITRVDDCTVRVSAQQGCDFAKQIAGDFNPIHDHDSKRFCVPGDLLFVESVRRLGLYQSMHFDFLDMLSADVNVVVPSQKNVGQHSLTNTQGKPLVGIDIKGKPFNNQQLAAQFAQDYVKFSAKSFPDILAPLMKQHKVMINPLRPLIIYKSMSFHIDDPTATSIQLKLDTHELEVLGKRGYARFRFNLSSAGKNIGHGEKKLILSGLREYQEESMNALTATYLAKKNQYILNIA
mgnify:CR=1 FL=1